MKKDKKEKIQRAFMDIGVVVISTDELIDVSSGYVRFTHYNPESLLNARADYKSLSEPAQHVLVCLISGKDLDVMGVREDCRGRKRKCYFNAVKKYITHTTRSIRPKYIFDEIAGFIQSLNEDQLSNITKIVV